MTAKKSLKKRVRARQQETGERYTEALTRVKAEGADAKRVPVVEMPNASAEAKAAGLLAKAFVSGGVWTVHTEDAERRAFVQRAFETLMEVLRVTEGDVTTTLLRRSLLGGEPGPRLTYPDVLAGLEARELFRKRLRLGVRGVSPDGRSIAFEAPRLRVGQPVVLVASVWPVPGPVPVLHLGLAEEWLAPTTP